MNLRNRIITAVAAPALMAGVLLAGSAAARPAAAAASASVLPDTVGFTATVIVANSTFTVNSTSCTLTPPGKAKAVSCHLAGSGSFDEESGVGAVNLAIVSTAKYGPIALSFTQAGDNCFAATGIDAAKSGPFDVVAKGSFFDGSVTELGSNMFSVKGTIKVSPATASVCNAPPSTIPATTTSTRPT